MQTTYFPQNNYENLSIHKIQPTIYVLMKSNLNLIKTAFEFCSPETVVFFLNINKKINCCKTAGFSPTKLISYFKKNSTLLIKKHHKKFE